jgi:phosphoglycerate dehydrogenase-like enzyme
MMTIKIAVRPLNIFPELHDTVARVAAEIGASIGDPSEADALIWTDAAGDPAVLRSIIDENPNIRWVHLGPAGIERFVPYLDNDRVWTCGKGVFDRPVAELTLALMLAGFRCLHRYARETSWTGLDGRSLFGAKVTVLGGGGVAQRLAELLVPFDVELTVVRNRVQPMDHVANVVGTDDLQLALADADQVVLALALTPETRHIIDERALATMASHAWIVNVARGAHIDTEALVTALQENTISGAALDVTEPEPLPDGHPLWTLPNALITPHTANPASIGQPMSLQRAAENIRCFVAGEPLIGTVDVELGY